MRLSSASTLLRIGAASVIALLVGSGPAESHGRRRAPPPCTPVCHVPHGNPENAHTLCLPCGAARAHLRRHRDDTAGECPPPPPPPPEVAYSTCAPVTVATFHGDVFHGNSRLARIEEGHVPCRHVETAEAAMCVFTTGSSGDWVEAADGAYAKTGLAIAPTGEPGGEWVVAARVNADGTVPCVASVGQDTYGHVTPGEELAATCVLESMLQDFNTLSPLINFGQVSVCTSSNPHPDGAALVEGTTWCYEGPGTALNDINGTERDELETYYLDTERCHYARSGGFEVPAAKRPATRSLPAPGQVIPTSPLVWRPVNNNLHIFNTIP